MLDSLALLVIAFMVMSVISIIGVALLYLIKNEKIKKGIFYFLVAWGMVIAFFNIKSIPIYMTGEILLAGALGAVGVAALVIQLVSKKEKKFQVAKILATVSVVVGMIDCFMF